MFHDQGKVYSHQILVLIIDANDSHLSSSRNEVDFIIILMLGLFFISALEYKDISTLY